MIKRRHVLTGLAATIASPWVARAAEPRIAALGWSCAQTMMAFGVTPICLPELDRYSRLVVEPAAPASVQEIGLRSEPNLELLHALKPDLIIIEPTLVPAIARLREIAPVENFVNLKPGARPLATARAATIELARKLGKLAECEAYLKRADANLDRNKDQLRFYDGAPLYMISEILRNRALVYGPTSLYQDVLDRFGIKNAYTGPSTIFGHQVIGLEELATVPNARMVLLSSRLADVKAVFAMRPMLQSLPFLREGRMIALAEILFYGGVPSAERFGRLLADKLPKGQT